jgi:prepilin-type processing-associated H-X9-DG protein
MVCRERSRLKRVAAIHARAAAVGLLAVLAVLPACRVQEQGGPQGESCPERLAQIGAALRAYHDAYGSFPPVYVADSDGWPMYSWRVLLLPYLGHETLYDEFDLGRPWDDPANRRLADAAVDAFHCPADDRGTTTPSPTTTSYLAVGGPGTAWSGGRPTSLGEITDPASATILVVEVAQSGVHWSEPRDLNLIQMAPGVNPNAGQGISSFHAGGAYVLMADGSTVFLPSGIPPANVRAMLTTAGGEEVDPSKL